MFRKTITIALLVCFLSHISCATTRVPVTSHDYNKLREVKTIFVTTKSGSEYMLVDFEMTETHIKGTHISSYLPLTAAPKRIIEIELEDVEYIHFEKTDVTKSIMTAGGIALGIAALIVVIYAFAIYATRGVSK